MKKYLNTIPKSLRERKRYILFSLKQKISVKELNALIQEKFLKEFGAMDFAKANPKLALTGSDYALLRVNFAWAEKSKKSLKGIPAVQGIISVHGTIKSAKRKKEKKGT